MQDLGKPEKRELLAIARRTIAQHLTEPPAEELDLAGLRPGLCQPAGAFVSLHVHGEPREATAPRLRGCIGTFEADEPLAQIVQRMAIAAATRDPRFPPVRPAELEQLEIEISVLSPSQRVAAQDVVPGTHGLQISQGSSRGVLLPQVAADNNWDQSTFLQQTCRKAGLALDAWRHHDTCIEVFTAQVFNETAAGSDQ